MNKQLLIDAELRDLFPSLTEEEFNQLEQNIIKDGCLSPLFSWNGYIVDGHNRYNICTKHNIEFESVELAFESKDEVIIWMIDTQVGRRNISDFVKYELKQRKAEVLKEKGRDRSLENLRQNAEVSTVDTSIESKKTRDIIAEELGWSTGKVAQADVVSKKASEEDKEKLRKGSVSINQVYKDIKEKEKSTSLENNRQSKYKTCTKCKDEKTVENFYLGHDICKDCEQDESQKRERKPTSSNSVISNEEFKEVYKELKDPNKVASEVSTASSGISLLETLCEDFIDEFDLQFFEMAKYVDKMTDADIDLTINIFNNFIIQIEDIKNKLKKYKARENNE